MARNHFIPPFSSLRRSPPNGRRPAAISSCGHQSASFCFSWGTSKSQPESSQEAQKGRSGENRPFPPLFICGNRNRSNLARFCEYEYALMHVTPENENASFWGNRKRGGSGRSLLRTCAHMKTDRFRERLETKTPPFRPPRICDSRNDG